MGHVARAPIVALIAAAFVVAFSQAALAYHTDGREGSWDCIDCHGDDRDPWTGEGPHGYYTTTTKKCRMCHTVHAAAGSILLLPADTISGTCMTCHDNTGAVGVYSSITARGGSVAASHSIDATATIPGGSGPLAEPLSCNSCHTVHRATQLDPYLKDTGKAFGSKEFIWTNSLLRDDVNGAARGTYLKYGAEWCAACHDQRSSWSPTHNHPTTQTAEYDLGRSNDGYKVAGVTPYCQQCHEDARDVETTFSASFKDYGYPSPDAPTNPAYVTFPHQTTNANLLVEQGDDLCTNCHAVASLP